MQIILVLNEFSPELEHTSGSILDHIAALHALGVEVYVSVAGKGRVLCDTLEDRRVPYGVTYSDFQLERTESRKHTSPLANWMQSLPHILDAGVCRYCGRRMDSGENSWMRDDCPIRQAKTSHEALPKKA